MKLLLVEDDLPFANTLCRRLEKNGFECLHIDNIQEALLACHRHQPSYILLDMKLHNDSSLALISPIRQLLPSSRIILLTGYASISTAVDAIKLGADDYLSKPVDTQTLLAALNNCHVNELTKLSGENSHHINSYSLKNEAQVEEEVTLSAEQVEWQHIQQVLKYNDGNISATARQLSMHRRTLQRKLQKRPTQQPL